FTFPNTKVTSGDGFSQVVIELARLSPLAEIPNIHQMDKGKGTDPRANEENKRT
ncbi:unnamed protein product, partial [Ilex paraguariensis]